MSQKLRTAAVAGLVLLGLGALLLTAGPVGQTLDSMRRDFLALRYTEAAMRAATTRPTDRREAHRKLTRALELSPHKPTVLAAAPEILVSIGAYDNAAKELARQNRADPYLLGLCLLKRGDEDAGARLLLGAAETAKRQFEAHRIGEIAYALQMNNVGYMLADAGVALDRAEPMLNIATDIMPLDANCVDSLGWLHYRLGDYRKALFLLERAVRLQEGPDEPDILYHLGAACAREGQGARAEKALRKALRLDPQHEDAQRELMRLQWLLTQPGLVRTAGRS